MSVSKNSEQISEKEKRSKLGKRSKNKGAGYERTIAKVFEKYTGVKLTRTPLSGGFARDKGASKDFKGDIVCIEEGKDISLSIECKCHKTWSLPAWLRQSEEDAPEGRIPVVVFHQHNTSNDYIALSLEDFLSIVPPERIVRSTQNDD